MVDAVVAFACFAKGDEPAGAIQPQIRQGVPVIVSQYRMSKRAPILVLEKGLVCWPLLLLRATRRAGGKEDRHGGDNATSHPQWPPFGTAGTALDSLSRKLKPASAGQPRSLAISVLAAPTNSSFV
jgi:hypothetical protein